jgi:valyl-tRNA synthetase
MPFVTQKIWEIFFAEPKDIAFAQFPIPNASHNFTKEVKEFDLLIKKAAAPLEEDKEKKIAFYKKEIERGEKLLGNIGFIKNAPKNLIIQEEEKLVKNKETLYNLMDRR